MMFNVRALQSGKYGAIATALDYESSLDELPNIEIDLKKHLGAGNKAKVIFDLLCPNGLGLNRFFQGDFDGDRIDLNSIENLPIQDLDEHLLQEQKKLFWETGILKNSVLSQKAIGEFFS